ncbi:hypothetical protein SEA_KNOCKER_63 [Mycobacterium phage Knocker]|nr:hypothetical protein SEA_KNOCKER_63 [Mycobacterium phage Knocker]
MPTTTTAKSVTFGIGLAVGLALGIPAGGWLAAQSDPAPVAVPAEFGGEPGAHTYVQRMTDLLDPPAEDDPEWDAERHGNGIVGPAWDCTTMGDRICQTVVTVPANLTDLMVPR